MSCSISFPVGPVTHFTIGRSRRPSYRSLAMVRSCCRGGGRVDWSRRAQQLPDIPGHDGVRRGRTCADGTTATATSGAPRDAGQAAAGAAANRAAAPIEAPSTRLWRRRSFRRTRTLRGSKAASRAESLAACLEASSAGLLTMPAHRRQRRRRRWRRPARQSGSADKSTAPALLYRVEPEYPEVAVPGEDHRQSSSSRRPSIRKAASNPCACYGRSACWTKRPSRR